MNCPACAMPISRGNLSRHRQRPAHIEAVARLGGDPSVRPSGQTTASPSEFAAHFWARVDMSGGADACWPWLGARQARGYGKVYRRGHVLVASRVALELARGRALPDGVFACHTCDNPPCCNPAHLAEGTNQDNLADLSDKGLMPVGVSRPNAKLDDEAVRAIRSAAGSGSYEAIGARHGVSGATVRDIIAGRKWRHVA